MTVDVADVAGPLALFPVDAPAPVIPEQDNRTKSKRRSDARRARQEAALAIGQHPLTAALRGSIRLHPDAVRSMSPADGGPRCGGCVFRAVLSGAHAGSFPKCTAGAIRHVSDWSGTEHVWHSYPRQTDGEGTDVRKYWPACVDYRSPKDGTA